MAVRFLTYPKFQAQDDNGNPLESGKVFVYAAGTTNKIDTWTDFNQTSKNTNPVILDARGEANIFFDARAKIVLKDSNDVTVWTLDDVSPLNAQTVTGKFNLVENGSFELDGDGDGRPDSWNLVETTDTSVIEIDTSTVAHGANSLKFSSGGGGAGTATTADKFSVSAGSNVGVNFFIESTSATVTNKVDMIFYDSSGLNPATTNIYNNTDTNPTTFEQKAFSVSVPSGKTQAELKLTGVEDAQTATTYFDNVQVLEQSFLSELDSIASPYDTARVELGGDFDAGEEVVCERIANTVTITSTGGINHANGTTAVSSTGAIPSQFRSSFEQRNVYDDNNKVQVQSDGTLTIDHSGISTGVASFFSITYVITANIT